MNLKIEFGYEHPHNQMFFLKIFPEQQFKVRGKFRDEESQITFPLISTSPVPGVIHC